MTPDELLPLFFRLLPLLVLFPPPGIDRLPATVRVVFCLAMTVCLGNAVPPAEVGSGVALLLTGFLAGTALALGVHACFAGLHLGGSLIDAQAGTGSASLFNPGHGGGGILTEFLVMAVAVTVLLSDTVLVLLGASMTAVPAGIPDVDVLLATFGGHFAAGFFITFPLVAGLWLVDVLATASSRLLPQANVYFLFLPLKTLFAVLLFAAGSAALLSASNALVRNALAG